MQKDLSNSAFSQIPVRLWSPLVQILGEKFWTSSSKAELHKLGEDFTAGEDVIDDKSSSKMSLSPGAA